MRNFYLGLFVASCLLPFVKVLPVDSDTQPNAVLFALGLLFISLPFLRLSGPLLWLWVLPPLGLAVFIYEVILGSDLLNNFRSLYNYIALPVISTTVALHAVRIRAMIIPLTNIFNLTYLGIAIAQWFTGQQMVGSIIGGGYRVGNYDIAYRGVVGLAPEPTYYATILFLFLIIYFICGKERSWWTLLCVFQIVFLARSTMVIMFLVLVFLIRALLARRIWILITVGILVLGIGTAVVKADFFAGSRVNQVLTRIAQNPANIIEEDYSIGSRLLHTWYACFGLFRNYGLPNGYNSFMDYYNSQMDGTVWISERAKVGLRFNTGRIMSGYGAALFELGPAGLVVPCVIIVIIKRRYNSLLSERGLTCIASISMILLGGTPIGFPLVGLIVGLLAAMHRRSLGGVSSVPLLAMTCKPASLIAAKPCS